MIQEHPNTTFHNDWCASFIEAKNRSEYVNLGDQWTHFVKGCDDVHISLNNVVYTFKNAQYVPYMNKRSVDSFYQLSTHQMYGKKSPLRKINYGWYWHEAIVQAC